jgi:CBS domain-containing protein
MKQLKSTCEDLRTLFERDITVRHVVEELKTFDLNDKACEVQKEMEELDFDVSGIRRDGVVYGYVERTTLGSGQCKEYVREFLSSEIIAQSAPLAELFGYLHDSPRVFVKDQERIIGIVTRGDLQKAPVRMYYFGLISLTEMQLLRIVRSAYPQESWKKLLTSSRLKDANDILLQRKTQNEALDLADCLQICDKLKIVCNIPEVQEYMRNRFGKTKELTKSIESLRNKLAHANDLVTGSTWTKVIDLAGELQRLLEFLEKIC